MGGKKYFCDYCEVRIQNNPQIIKKHNEGLPHQTCKIDHFEKFKSLKEILEVERSKMPCKRVASCAFGKFCRFSHYSAVELSVMGQKCKEIAEIESQSKVYRKSVEEFFEERHRTRISSGFKNKIYFEVPESSLPPSLHVWDLNQLEEDPTSDWG